MLDEWQRLEYQGRPVYVQPEKPDWFVPNREADHYLQSVLRLGSAESAICEQGQESLAERLLLGSRLTSQLATTPAPAYKGRGKTLQLGRLKETWFHLTNNCNLACKHCLFGASPAEQETLSKEQLDSGIAQALDLGCTLFYFTGGEPFVYPGFSSVLADLLATPSAHAVVLTNGMLIEENLDAIKNLPKERLHLQISLDGLEKSHESLRGSGTFKKLLHNLEILQDAGFSATLSVAVSRANVHELAEIVALAGEHGVKNIHLLWHFVRGKGNREQFVAPQEILPELIRAQEQAELSGVAIDNVETMRSQVFSTPGTRYDLSNTAWESLAVGPDGNIYPSPALVAVEELNCGPLSQGLDAVWRKSKVLSEIREATLLASENYRQNPLKYLVGGGDVDHSFLAGGEFVGHDPYVELYNGLSLWLITTQAEKYEERSATDIQLKMGDVRYDCPDGGQEVCLTHCNCVISLADDLGHSSVRDFYAAAAMQANEDIVNPFAAGQADATFIPEESRKKSYGCGSPVKDAEPKPGETLVDLGSGSGVECFMAAAEVGSEGKVYGIDMTDEMLNLARSSKEDVATKLGYDNVEFKKGFLEEIPLADDSVDVVISNCVINLSPDKRQVFAEVFRILKPGGRMVVSDIVTDLPIPVTIKNNEQFRGECLGGALMQEDLMAMLRATGFTGARLVKRFPYRQEDETEFYSLTFSVYKPEAEREVEVIYRGPFAAIHTESGAMLLKGKRAKILLSEAKSLDDSIFLLDDTGAVTNLAMENSCCAPQPVDKVIPLNSIQPPDPLTGCCGCSDESAEKSNNIVRLPPQLNLVQPGLSPAPVENGKHPSGCMVCGGEITYLKHHEEHACYYCGGTCRTNAVCAEGHFICDDCHQQDGLSTIKVICTETREQDMLILLDKVRQHPAIPMHGPEHHAMVPGIILASYRNRGGMISKESILTGIERGSKVPGGVCGFWGNCGAAAGVGIAFSVLLEATPLTPAPRQQVQEITSRVLAAIAQTKGDRCCQRETVTALKEAVKISRELLPLSLLAGADFACGQFQDNKQCIRVQCPLWNKESGQKVES